MTSVARTVTLPPAQPQGNRIWQPIMALPALWWPTAEPADDLDYYADATAPLAGDTIISASLAIQPSGTGEMQPADLSVVGSVIGVWLAGGVPGRTYTAQIVARTEVGRTFVWLIGIVCDPLLASFPIPTAPSPGFGPAVTWNNGGGVADALLGADGMYLLGADGDFLTYGATVAYGLLSADGTQLEGADGDLLTFAHG